MIRMEIRGFTLTSSESLTIHGCKEKIQLVSVPQEALELNSPVDLAVGCITQVG
jgi:hypothetical protein